MERYFANEIKRTEIANVKELIPVLTSQKELLHLIKMNREYVNSLPSNKRDSNQTIARVKLKRPEDKINHSKPVRGPSYLG